MDENLNSPAESKKASHIFLIVLSVLMFAGVVGGLIYYFSLPKETAKPTENNTKKAVELKFDKQAATSDPFNDPGGPFFHNVFGATSSDGLNFIKTKNIVLEKASVPDIVKMKDGKLLMVAVDGARRSNSGLMVAMSEDSGVTWKQGSLQLQSPSGGGNAVDPEVILTDEGKVRLFYVVMGDKPGEKPPLDVNGQPVGGTARVMSALSDDGVSYVEEQGERYKSEGSIVTDPDIVKIGSKWFMYVSKGEQNIALTSDDGNTFKLQGVIRAKGSVSKTVSIGNGEYRQFYCNEGIKSDLTTDGLNFKPDNIPTRLTPDAGKIVCDPAPIQIGNEWLMFYKQQDTPSKTTPGVEPPKPVEVLN